MRVLFAVSSWGLGHATRDLVLIRALLTAGHDVTVVSTDRALRLLRRELGRKCDFLDLPDIPKPLGRRATEFYLKMSLALPVILWTFRWEHLVIRRICRAQRFDRIVSDCRYGVCIPDIPSFPLLHTVHQIIPGRSRRLERVTERIQQRIFQDARKVLIPDQEEHGLAGDLCHNLSCFRRDQLEYIGILSSVRRRPVEPDIDYFITVSGPEPQRGIFERIVLKQARDLEGRVVIALGKPEVSATVSNGDRVAVHSFMDRRQQEEMLNRARLVVTRSGYTTLMELAELGKRALLIPTVGQTEQEYLGTYHEKLGTMHSVAQARVVLSRDVATAATYRGIPITHSTEESARRFLQVLE